MKRTISVMVGRGSVSHNSRKFHAKNTDPERSHLNIDYCNDYFTVSFYPEKYRRALGLLGSLSGRDGDKVKMAGLTPRALNGAVTFCEAKVTLLCKKIYRQDMDTSAMPAEVIEDYYNTEALHTMYVGEVMEILI